MEGDWKNKHFRFIDGKKILKSSTDVYNHSDNFLLLLQNLQYIYIYIYIYIYSLQSILNSNMMVI